MNDVLKDAIRSAERALRGVEAERPAVERKIAGVQTDLGLLSRPSAGEDLAYLVSLADGLGLHDAAEDLLENFSSHLIRDALSLSGMNESELNQLAVAVAGRGHLSAAARLLSASASEGSVSVVGLANQAAVKLRAGELMAAVDYADRARSASDQASTSVDLNARFLATAVMIEVRRQEGQHEEADRLIDELSDIARRLVPLLGRDHPRALTTLVTVATAECESAAAAHDVGRLARAADVIAIATQRISAALGSEHPRAVSALRCLTAAEYGLAQATNDTSCLRGAFSLAAAAITRSDRRRLPTQQNAAETRPSASAGKDRAEPRRATSWHGPEVPPSGATTHRGSGMVPLFGPRVATVGNPSEEQYSLVRPYAMTGGRTRPATRIAIEALVSTTAGPSAYGALAPEQQRILHLCEDVKSVAEVSALLNMPLGVARVLVSDLAAVGLVAIHEPSAQGEAPDASLLQRVLDGLRRL
jgi:hypothetical protein